MEGAGRPIRRIEQQVAVLRGCSAYGAWVMACGGGTRWAPVGAARGGVRVGGGCVRCFRVPGGGAVFV